jgi:hypothetical protein
LAQDAPAPDSPAHIGIPEDWSTHRVLYTRNGSVEDMMRVRNDPRFLVSFLLHNGREHAGQYAPSAGLAVDRPMAGTDDDQADQQRGQAVGLIGNPNFKKAKVDWAMSLGASFGMAIGESPAKFTFNPSATPTCTVGSTPGDFVVFSLKAAPTVGGQGNLVALTNLYSGTSPTGFCGTAPTWLFSYAIGTGGSLLSPVLSLDGTQVAWIENTSANHAVFHVSKWKLGDGTDATHSVAMPTGAACTASTSCDVAIDYTSAAASGCTASTNINTNSEIYVDYSSHTAFVGADNGILYHFKNVFNGTPAVDFCIAVNTSAGIALSGGVYDSLLNPPVFFIADSKKLYAYTVGATSFTLKTSYTYGNGTLTGPGPILDAFNNFIYTFSANDLATHTSVTQLSTALAAPSVAALGPASTNSWAVLFYGAFDNNYFTLGPANTKSTLYSCGTDPTTTNAQDLYAINFNSSTGVMNTAPVMGANKNVNPGGKNGTCSPITEFFDGTTDRIFVGIGQHSATTGGNVVTMWDVTTQLTNASTTPTATATAYLGGSSGLVADNSANTGTYPQAASVYFTTLATSGTSTTCGANNYCAVKLTQSGLK